MKTLAIPDPVMSRFLRRSPSPIPRIRMMKPPRMAAARPPAVPPTRPLPMARQAIPPMVPRPEAVDRHLIIPATGPARPERTRPTVPVRTEARPASLVMVHHRELEVVALTDRRALAHRDPPMVLPVRQEMQAATSVPVPYFPCRPHEARLHIAEYIWQFPNAGDTPKVAWLMSVMYLV